MALATMHLFGEDACLEAMEFPVLDLEMPAPKPKRRRVDTDDEKSE